MATGTITGITTGTTTTGITIEPQRHSAVERLPPGERIDSMLTREPGRIVAAIVGGG